MTAGLAGPIKEILFCRLELNNCNSDPPVESGARDGDDTMGTCTITQRTWPNNGVDTK